VLADERTTPLWWLPHDEAKALHVVEVLLAHGANPSQRSMQGKTAADWAMTMGMPQVAAKLAAAAVNHSV
jgi:ankyrin repeat protein